LDIDLFFEHISFIPWLPFLTMKQLFQLVIWKRSRCWGKNTFIMGKQ